MGCKKRNVNIPQFTDHCFTGDYPIVPIDKSLVEKSLLSKNEINWFNNYHYKVFSKLKKFMNKSELVNLKNSCSNI